MVFYHHLILSVLFFVTAFCSTICHVNAQQHEYIIEFGSSAEASLFLENNKEMISKVRQTYSSDVFTGVAVEFKDPKVAKNLESLDDHIVKVWPIHHRIRQQAPVRNQYDDSKDDNTFVPQNEETIKILTQANDKYQSLKSNGTGIKIGIIDSGVDYTLAALGGCFGEGCKVAYGYDLVGNGFNGSSSSIRSSNDPLDDCPANSTSATGHGTFVTGIIAAEDKEYNWNGVAPGATIGMWRVYGCNYPAAPNDIIIKAMEMAYEAKMDVISISLGVSGGWAEDVLSVVADRMVAKGIHVVTASGNIGTSGLFLTASPATGRNVIAAGATMNTHVPGYILKLYNIFKKDAEIPYRTYTSTAFSSNLNLDKKRSIVPTSEEFNAENDACTKLNTKFHNKYNGSIALIHLGGCSSLEKIMHARNAGATAVILYSDIKNETTDVEILSTAALPVAFINNNDGKTAFKARQAAFTNVLVALKSADEYMNSVASFSTLGPTNELELKPELMAVGGDVFSTLPRYLKSYGFRSGTSFSTPYIAGTVALLLSNTQPDMKPKMAKSLLMNFADQVREPISAVHYGDSPIRQGAGVVDVAQAIGGYEQFHVSPAKLSFNDTVNFLQEQVVTIYNHNTEKESTFYLGHLPSLTATGYSLYNTSDLTPLEPVGLYGEYNSTATVRFSETKLVVPAGDSVQVRVRIQPPTNFASDSHAIYGGYISVNDGKQQATIPYIGMVGNMNDLPILDRSNKPSKAANYTFPAIGFNNGTGTYDPNETIHIHIQKKYPLEFQGPYLLVRLLTGTSILQIQVLDKHGSVVGDVPMDGTRSYMVRNTLTATEYTYAFYSWLWNGVYVPKDVTLSGTNGGHKSKLVKSGDYRLKVRGLRVYGDMKKKTDWDEWISPRIQLKID